MTRMLDSNEEDIVCSMFGVYNACHYYILSCQSKKACSTHAIQNAVAVTQCPMYNTSLYVHENKNSLRTGDPENSGFKSMQLCSVSPLPLLCVTVVCLT